MMRLAASVVVWMFLLISAVEAAKDSDCPPAISAHVVRADAKTFTIQIAARNTCTCRILFRACPQGSKRGCNSARIGPGETKQIVVETSTPDGTADYNWNCRWSLLVVVPGDRP